MTIRHAAVLTFSQDVIKQWLHIPSDMKIVGANYDALHDCVCLVLEHPSLPAVAEGAIPPSKSLVVKLT